MSSVTPQERRVRRAKRRACHRPALPQRAQLHAVVAQQEQGDVVAARGVAEEVVGDQPRVAGGRGGQLPGEAVHALVDVGVGRLDEPVGDKGDQGAGWEPQRAHREVGPGDHAERRAAFGLGDLRRAVGVPQYWREVPGAHAPCGTLLQVDVDVGTGGEQVAVHVHEEPVGVRDHHVRRVPLDGVGAQRGPHLTHQGGGARAVALDVADDEGHMVVGQRNDVVPVAAEFQPGGAGQVAGDGHRARQRGQAAREELALEHADEFVFGVEGAGPHERLSGEARAGGEQGTLVGAEVVRAVPADQADPGHAVTGGQRQDGQTAGADLRQGALQGAPGGPDPGAALAQGGGEGRHGAHGRVGPLGTPFRAPQLRPRLGFGRIENGDDQPVGLQLGECDPVGPEGPAQRGDHGLADIADGDGGGQRGGQALDADHVGDVGAQRGGVGDGADEPGGAALPAGQEPPAQPEPLGRPGGLEHPELQLPVPDRHVVGLHHGHQRGQVLRHGVAQERLDPAVELHGVEAEQVQQVVADPDAAAVHGEGEGARWQVTTLGGRGRGGEGDRVGDESEALAVFGVEPVGVLAHGEETAAAVPLYGQGHQVELPGGHASRLDVRGELPRPQRHRPSVAVGRGDRGPAVAGVAVAQPVQRPRYPGRLHQAQQLTVLAGHVHGDEGRTGEDESLFEDAAHPFG